VFEIPKSSAPTSLFGNPEDFNHDEAGFWSRACAISIDAILIRFVILLVYSFVWISIHRFHPAWYQDRAKDYLFRWAIAIGIWCLYWAVMESSAMQATIGKRVMKIAVVDMYGNRLSFARASLRALAHWISFLLFGIGFLMAAFTEQKQALHDFIAGTLVVSRKSESDASIQRSASLSDFDELRIRRP
jgi:uncharacterized RDD family membrane protein YckC